jgi:hypothetical protein
MFQGPRTTVRSRAYRNEQKSGVYPTKHKTEVVAVVLQRGCGLIQGRGMVLQMLGVRGEGDVRHMRVMLSS